MTLRTVFTVLAISALAQSACVAGESKLEVGLSRLPIPIRSSADALRDIGGSALGPAVGVCGEFAGEQLSCNWVGWSSPSDPVVINSVEKYRQVNHPPSAVIVLKPWPPALATSSALIPFLADLDELPKPLTDQMRVVSGREVPGVADLQWVFQSDAIHGQSVVAAWAQMANDGTLFDCRRGSCARLIRGWARVEGKKVEGIASSRVELIGNKRTVPRQCFFIQVELESPIVMAVTSFYVHAYFFAGRSDSSVYLPKAGAESEPTRERESNVLGVIAAALETPPLNLNVSVQAGKLVAERDFVYLKPIGYWTRQTVVIDKRDSVGVNGQSYQAYDVATTLYVSPRNSQDSGEWNLPGPATTTQYLELVRAAVERGFRQTCKQGLLDKRLGGHMVACAIGGL